jgi:hypothetical protein
MTTASSAAASAINMFCGSIKLISTYKVEGETVYLGGYSIRLDRDGHEVSRTENSWNCAITNVPDYCLPLLTASGERL